VTDSNAKESTQAARSGPAKAPERRSRPGHRRPERGPRCPAVSVGSLGYAHRRLEHLYEIGQVLMRAENADETLPAVIAITTDTLPLRSATFILERQGRRRTFGWKAEGEPAGRLAAARVHAHAAYAYLAGSGVESEDDEAAEHLLPALASGPPSDRAAATRYVVLPLAVARRPVFGALQLESAARLVESDLVFVNAVVNQLAIALDRQATIEARQAATEVRRMAAEDRRVDAEGRKATAELATRWRDDLLAIVSHDLRSPLGVIRMNTSLLLRSLEREASEQSRKHLSAIMRSAERMAFLVEDLIAGASIQEGRLSIERKPTAVAAMVSSAIEAVQPLCVGKALRLESALVADLPLVFADSRRILQVLVNLLGNAIKFAPKGGAIAVRGGRARGGVRLAVTDSGPGIGAEAVPHLFDRFWQGPGGIGHGAGLGLFIVKGIVEAHGGSVWVETEVGKGTTFFFTLPAAQWPVNTAA
jgi:signal transduction histidine kinase